MTFLSVNPKGVQLNVRFTSNWWRWKRFNDISSHICIVPFFILSEQFQDTFQQGETASRRETVPQKVASVFMPELVGKLHILKVLTKKGIFVMKNVHEKCFDFLTSLRWCPYEHSTTAMVDRLMEQRRHHRIAIITCIWLTKWLLPTSTPTFKCYWITPCFHTSSACVLWICMWYCELERCYSFLVSTYHNTWNSWESCSD